jgi:LTXXQ motif family protein
VKSTLLAASLAATVAIAIPLVARSAEEGELRYAQAAPMSADSDEHGMADGDHAGMRGWPMMRGMMRHHMMIGRGDPQERCIDRLAWRAAGRAYVETKLNLTAQQQPLWDKVQSAAQSEEQKERQLCASLKPGAEPTMLDRMDRMQQFLSARLEALQAARPAVQALYQALTPEQQAILNHPFRRP